MMEGLTSVLPEGMPLLGAEQCIVFEQENVRQIPHALS